MEKDKKYDTVFRNNNLIEFADGSVRCLLGDFDYSPQFYTPKKSTEPIVKKVEKK